MPALITHHLFGERSATLLPEGVISGEEELLAFLLGNQGPDPFFFRVLGKPAHVKAAQALAHRMHDELMTAAFSSLREGVSHLPEADAGVGRAFALGLLSHYQLDRTAHPFVYAQEFAIIEASRQAQVEGTAVRPDAGASRSDAAGSGTGAGAGSAGLPDLSDAASEIHAVIESDLDSWMLWRLRRATVHDCAPADELTRTERICRVAGALTSQVAWATYGIDLPATEYAGAVANMEALYRIIEPAGSLGARTAGRLERLVRAHSQLQSLSHRVTTSDACEAANLDHRPWRDPFAGTLSCDSFPDRFDKALAGWPALSEAFTRGGEQLREAVAGLNYSGVVLGADEICPPEKRG